MDRRIARRVTLDHLATMEACRDRLEVLASDAETAGDPILSGELHRYLEKLTALLDQMYVWAGNL